MTREDYLEDKAMVIAIANIQNLPSILQPTSDMMGMCQMLRKRTSPEYLASLVFSVEIMEGKSVDILADLDEDADQLDQSDLEFSIDLESALSAMRVNLARRKELAAAGANNGSNVIDFNAHRRRRGLPVNEPVAA